MATTPKGLFPLPDLPDAPNVPYDMLQLGSAVEAEVLKGVPVFADTAARNAALPTPATGSLCFMTDTLCLVQFNGSVWGHVGVFSVSLGSPPNTNLRGVGGQLEVWGVSAVTTVAHANAAFANQSMTLGQKTVLEKVAAPLPADPEEALQGLAGGLTPEALEAAGVELIEDEDGNAVGFHHEQLLHLIVAVLAGRI